MSCKRAKEGILTKLTIEDGRNALTGHIYEKALAIQKKYGNVSEYNTLCELLKDSDFVRYPTRVEFNSALIERGTFATARLVSDKPSDGYVIFVHSYFKDKLEYVPPLVLYHLVTVNYGDFASSTDAELFGATILGLEKEEYYQFICQLADQIEI